MTRNEDARQSVQNNADRVHTIGLCMIVKNEAQVITRCLDSVKGLVDYVLIEDTGSTDSTQQVIRDWLKRENMLGEVIEEPWQSFAYNRSHVMAKLGQVEGVDYALIIDADDRIVLEDAFRADAWKAAMDVDLYDVRISHGGARFFRPQICSNRKGFYFKAVLHEYLEGPPEGFTRKNAEGFYIQTGSGGARNKNPRKYQDDAAALEKALQTETDPFLISRYTFYLAQSYRDCGEKELALKNYLKRAEAGYWIEEVFESLYGAAKMKDALDHPEDEVIAAYLKAADTLPTRAEALHGAAKFCRAKGRNEEGYQYAKRGMAIARPGTGLFVESWVYDYGLLDELAVNAYWAGHAQDSLDASLKLLSGNMLPEDQRPRILANARFAFDKLPKEPNLGDAGKASLLDHHAMAPARPLRGRVVGSPRVLIAILAKQKEEMLPLYLECIEALDYPKSQIVLYIRTNNNTDRTEPILREWVERVRPLYADIEFDARDVTEQVQQFGAHEWNATRFKVLGEIRNLSMRRALEKNCEFYFVADADNFIRPSTLRELVALDLPIVSPLLRSIERSRYYSNYHAEVDKNGYFISSDQYMWILNQWIRGVVEVPVVHTTYLVRADVISDLNYVDTTGRHEYVIFSDTARKAQIPQYLDNRQVYGYIAFGKGSEQHVEGGIERARDLLKVAFEGDEEAGKQAATRRPLVFCCFGQHGSGSTWMFNLVRDVCKTKSIPFTSIHRDWSINLPWQTPGARVIVAKSHSPMADFQAFVASSPDPVVVTVRDPRDAVVSFMQRFSNSLAKSFEEALAAIALSAERLVAIKRLRDVPVLRYEDGFVGAQSTIAKVAELLGVTLSEQERNQVLADLKPDAVRAKIDELEKSGVIKTEADWDRDTQWHKGHVGDGKVGKWRDVLSPEQEREILDRTKEYCETFGYASPSKALDFAKIAHAGSQARRTVSPEELSAVCEIHLINLDRSKERLAKFMARNGHLGKVVRVPAVDGRETNREELQARGLIAADLPYTPGALGCALSHIGLWQKAVEENRIITIFEDDAVSSVNFEEGAARTLAQVPQDWDLIHWGCVFDPLFVWLDFDYVKATLHFYDRRFQNDFDPFQREGFLPTPVKLLHSFGTQAYSVSPKGAKALLDGCVPLQQRHITFPGAGVVTHDEGIDIAMDGVYPSMNAFLTLPPLVIQDRTQASDRIEEGNRVPDERIPERPLPEMSKHSQSGGLVNQIISRIGVVHKTFVEISGDVTAIEGDALLSKGWQGFSTVGRECESLTKIELAKLNGDNASTMLKGAGVPEDFDILILDLDFNDFHVLRNILKAFRPRAIVVEYNSSLGPIDDLVVPYCAAAQWDGTNYFGASFAAFCSLGSVFGYRAVICDDKGVDVGLVQENLWPKSSLEAAEIFREPRYGKEGRGHSADPFNRPYLTAQHYLIAGVESVETAFGRISYFERDKYIGSVFAGGHYWEEHNIRSVSARVAAERGLCLDIGAHIGSHSIALAKLNPRLNFLCFEPQHPLFLLLERNIYENGLHDRMKARNCAVGHRQGTCELANSIFDEDVKSDRPLNYAGNELLNFGGMQIGSGGAVVEMIAIDALELPRLVYVKVDVEGAEPLVLHGMKSVLERDRPFIHYEDRQDRRLDFEKLPLLQVSQEVSSASLSAILTALDYGIENLGLDYLAVPRRAEHDGLKQIGTKANNLIPKLIFQTWKNRSHFPRNFELWSKTLCEMNPKYDWVVWDDSDNRKFMSEHFPWFMPTYDAFPAEIYRVDAVRYFYLYMYGGIYADLDVECLKPLDDVLSRGDVIVGRMGSDFTNPHSIPNAIMASKARQAFWLLPIGLVENGPGGKVRPEFATGPAILKSAIDQYLTNDKGVASNTIQRIADKLPRDLRPSNSACDINILQAREWFPIDWTDPMHQRLRRHVLGGKFFSASEKSELFPSSSLVTYWAHSWE